MASNGMTVQPCKYRVGKVLGTGSYSCVKECVHIETGRTYAAKIINKRLMQGREHMVRNEIAILQKVSMGSIYVISMVDFFETLNSLYLIFELATGGELFDRICRQGQFTEGDAANVVRTILSAVAYLHSQGIVHRDLKPENLLYKTPEEDAQLLVADFGLSRLLDDEFSVLSTTCGTPSYMSPETLRKTGHGKPVDIWAVGVITFFLLSGLTPFDRETNLEEMQAILSADFSFTPEQYWQDVSETARDFIRRCLTVDPKKRPTAHEALAHPFVATTAPGTTNLLPTVKKNFNARRKLHNAIDAVRAINKLREGGAAVAAMNRAKAAAAFATSGKSGENGDANGNSNDSSHTDTDTDTMMKDLEEVKVVDEEVNELTSVLSRTQN